jgi:hypothetical protein
MALFAACQSPEQIQAEQDEADEQRCARMGVPLVPGDPRYIQCRMWATQMRDQEEQERRQAWLAVFTTLSAMQQQQRAPAYLMPLYDDEPPQPQWIVPPPPPQTTWCRPVGQWMSCTGQ